MKDESQLQFPDSEVLRLITECVELNEAVRPTEQRAVVAVPWLSSQIDLLEIDFMETRGGGFLGGGRLLEWEEWSASEILVISNDSKADVAMQASRKRKLALTAPRRRRGRPPRRVGIVGGSTLRAGCCPKFVAED